VAYRRKRIAAALAYALGIVSTAAWTDASAQEQQNPRILVTVTGSNIIPRIEGETALPVQVITREDRARQHPDRGRPAGHGIGEHELPGV
jgi:hypothetical protein